MKFDELSEAITFPVDVTIDEIIKMHEAARRGISILNRIKDPAQRKRHASRVFKNFNKISAMMNKLIKELSDEA